MNPSQLSIQHLVYLEALVLERHVTRASERVGIGQPAMSASLAKLRRQLKDPLLVKTSAGMEPTPRALELMRQARSLIDLIEGRSGSAAQFDPAVAENHFRIMAADGIASVLVPEFMGIVRQNAPHMRFTVDQGDSRRVAEYLRDGEFNLAITFVRPPPAELHQTILYSQRLVCVAAQDHPKIRGRISLKQFIAQPHVVWGGPPVPFPVRESIVDKALNALGCSRRVALRASSMTLLADVVATTDLLAVMSEYEASIRKKSVPIQVLPLPFELQRQVDVSMLWHERAHNDPAHKWLRSAIGEVGRRLAQRLHEVTDA